jgi:hypothetical protein
MKRLFPFLVFVTAIACDAQEKQVPVPAPSPEERIQELEARVASLEKILGTVSDELFLRDGRYLVKAGDTGARIAKRFEVTISDLMALNPGVRWDRLKVGQIVRVKKEEPNQAPAPSLTVRPSSKP